MDTHTFGNYSITCPICQREGKLKLVKAAYGLFICPYCQERIVVTWSGHYVRDPHQGKGKIVPEALRRQSRPLSRMFRDLGSFGRPALIVALSSTLLFGVSFITLQSLNSKQPLLQKLVDRVTEIGNHPQSH